MMSLAETGLVERCLDHAKNVSEDPTDFGCFFNGEEVGQVRRLAELTMDDLTFPASGDITRILEWMEARHLQPTDELILYHNGAVFNRFEIPWYTLKFRIPASVKETMWTTTLEDMGIDIQELRF